ncbi:Cro/CI family transcriptional regulator [Methylobacterium mesophilicum]
MHAEPLKDAITKAGGPVALSRALGISSAAVCQWRQCPVLRVIAVEKATGVPRHELRPDVYPPPAQVGAVQHGAAA